MPCPWYQHGMCTSPKLPEPVDTVVAIDRCGSENIYINCVYYVEEPVKHFRKEYQTKKDRVKIYAPIHALPPQLNCGCPECDISSTENGVRFAYCKLIDRYLTRYDVYLCSRYWRECPYRLYSSIST
ncbi:MAG: hypothetical protein QXI86_06190 [Ignisphaera sp.]